MPLPTRLRAYVSGALTGPGLDLRSVFEQTAAVLEQCGFAAYVPHLATDPVRHPTVTASRVYETDRRQVATADLVVAFLSRPSFGVGMELEIAAGALVPLLVVAREGEPLSRMALGGPARQYGPLRYVEWDDLEPQLRAILPEIATELQARTSGELPAIGPALTRARNARGLARETFARRVGVSEDYVRSIESAEPRVSNPTLAFLATAASVLGITLGDLLSTPHERDSPLLVSLRDFAVHDALSYREFAQLQDQAARGLRPDRSLTPEQWRTIREARARAIAGIEQLELPRE
jgi:transcriptional regulator with XRE-family HTH domain